MRTIFILFTLIPFFAFAQEEEQCVFDQATQTDEFVKAVPEFSNYKWNAKTKEATIHLQNGETLIAQRGGCYHFGLSGTLLTSDDTDLEDLDYWLNRALWIAERLFKEHIIQNLKKSIEEKTYTISDESGLYILFPHDYYSDFSMTLKKSNGKVELYIGYYFA